MSSVLQHKVLGSVEVRRCGVADILNTLGVFGEVVHRHVDGPEDLTDISARREVLPRLEFRLSNGGVKRRVDSRSQFQ